MIRFFKIVTPILLSISLVACSSASGKTEKITAPIEKDRNLSMVVTTDVHYF
ncbi:metallophosphoesterase, partial [Escherichia coli]|nr:metallophosphoesterase [Escherichia coli]